MVRLRLARPPPAIVVAQGKLLRIRKVRRYIRLPVLQFHRLRRPLQPGHVIMPRVASRWRILRRRQYASIHSRKRPEVIIKAVILLDDDHHVLNRILRFHGPLLLQFSHFSPGISPPSYNFVNIPLPLALLWCTLTLTLVPALDTFRHACPLRSACFSMASFPGSSSPSPSL